MTTSFNTDQIGMAIFLLVAAVFNGWFVTISVRRSFCETRKNSNFVSAGDNDDYNKLEDKGTPKPLQYQQLTYSVLTMALFDVLWVWLCMVQCWNNVFNEDNEFNQNSGEDSFGCKFMGWYSSFSLVSMMGSHCLVAFYLMKYLCGVGGNSNSNNNKTSFTDTTKGFVCLATSLLIASILFASMPLMQGDGYHLSNGGFCYADFTNTAQSSVILSVVLIFLILATYLWIKIGRWKQFWYYYAIFFVTWILWIPASAYGIATGNEISSPYMIIAAIIGHSNAIINPILYGHNLFKIKMLDDPCAKNPKLKNNSEPIKSVSENSSLLAESKV